MRARRAAQPHSPNEVRREDYSGFEAAVDVVKLHKGGPSALVENHVAMHQGIKPKQSRRSGCDLLRRQATAWR